MESAWPYMFEIGLGGGVGFISNDNGNYEDDNGRATRNGCSFSRTAENFARALLFSEFCVSGEATKWENSSI